MGLILHMPLRNIFRDETVKCAPVFFESVRLNMCIYCRLDFINYLSCIDFNFLFQKIKHGRQFLSYITAACNYTLSIFQYYMLKCVLNTCTNARKPS